MNDMNEILQEFSNIKMPDPASWWPLGNMAWGLVIIILLVLVLAAYFLYQRKQYRKSTKYKLITQLVEIQSKLEACGIDENSELAMSVKLETIQDISTLLRYAAIHKYGRKHCASLTGIAWITWLQQNDPAGFKWKNYHCLLLKNCYASTTNFMSHAQDCSREKILNLCHAAKPWVMQC